MKRLQHLQYGNSLIHYEVESCDSRETNVAIHVYPDGRVRVDAPAGARADVVKRAVLKRAGWLYRELKRIDSYQQHVLAREYVSGESHLYLGRRYVLKLIRSNENSVKLKCGQLQVRTPRSSATRVRELLYDWYRNRADEVFNDVIGCVSNELPWVRETPPWSHRQMSTRWGSCSMSGRLSLNTHLIKTPRSHIEYVVLHELCHLKHRKHNTEFYRLLTRQMRDWRDRKERLDDKAAWYLSR